MSKELKPCPNCLEPVREFVQNHEFIVKCVNDRCPLIVQLKGFWDASNEDEVRRARSEWNRTFEVPKR